MNGFNQTNLQRINQLQKQRTVENTNCIKCELGNRIGHVPQTSQSHLSNRILYPG